VVEAAGSDKSHVLKTTVFLKDMNDFAKVNVRICFFPFHALVPLTHTMVVGCL